MIGKVARGANVGGLVAYLFGPGRDNEHTDQHVVAHWTGLPDEVVPVGPDGVPDLSGLIEDLKTDLRAANLLGAEATVWHCSVSIPAADGPLADAAWREVAEAIAEAAGLEDPVAGAVRWVAVRHGLSTAGNDHIHIVATLAGRTEHGDPADRTYVNRDYAAVRGVCNRFERAWGLTVTGAGTGAAHQRPSRAETEIAARRGLDTELRVTLERAVRSAGVASTGPEDFTARLAAEGITVTFSRESEQRPGTWLGVTFHTDDYRNADGVPVAFSGRTLARDLSGPALQARWDARAAAVPAPGSGDPMADLVAALAAAANGAEGAGLDRLRGQIAASSDALWAGAEAVEADRGGVWHAAAGEAARAAREPGAVDHADAGLLLAALAELGGLPPASSKDEAQLRKAWALWQRLMRMWARAEAGENARVAAATAATVAALTGTGPRRTQRSTTRGPAGVAMPASQRPRPGSGDGAATMPRSGT